MTTTSMATSSVNVQRRIEDHESRIEGSVYILKATGDASQLGRVVSLIKENKASNPIIQRVELDITNVSHQDKESLLPVLACLMILIKSDTEFSARIKGVRETLLTDNAIKSFPRMTKAIQLEGNGIADAPTFNRTQHHLSIGLASTPEITQQNFMIDKNTEATTIKFTGPEIKIADINSAAQMVKDSSTKIILDLRNCTRIRREAVLSFLAIGKSCPVGTQLTILLKSNSEPDLLIEQLCKNTALSKQFAEIYKL